MERTYRLTIHPLEHHPFPVTTSVPFTEERLRRYLDRMYGSRVEEYAEGNAIVSLHLYQWKHEPAQLTRIKARAL